MSVSDYFTPSAYHLWELLFMLVAGVALSRLGLAVIDGLLFGVELLGRWRRRRRVEAAPARRG